MGRDKQRIEEILNKEIDPVYKELSAKIGEKDSKVMPYVFESLINLEQAKILNEEPAPSEEIAEKFNLDKETVENHIQYMFEIGLLFPGKSGWYLTRSWGRRFLERVDRRWETTGGAGTNGVSGNL